MTKITSLADLVDQICVLKRCQEEDLRVNGKSHPGLLEPMRDLLQNLHKDAEQLLVTYNEFYSRSIILEHVFTELVAVVRGECPSLLNEDSGGYTELAILINEFERKTND